MHQNDAKLCLYLYPVKVAAGPEVVNECRTEARLNLMRVVNMAAQAQRRLQSVNRVTYCLAAARIAAWVKICRAARRGMADKNRGVGVRREQSGGVVFVQPLAVRRRFLSCDCAAYPKKVNTCDSHRGTVQ